PLAPSRVEGKKCFAAPRENLAVRHRDGDGYTVFVADDSGDVALAGQVFGQIDAAWAELDFSSVDEFDLAVTAQCNDILAARRGVPVRDPARTRATDFGACAGHQLERIRATG